MRVTVTGGTGHIGAALIAELKRRGHDVAVLSRNPSSAARRLGTQAFPWHPTQPPPLEALNGRDAVVHLAGEDVAQRWTDHVKAEIRASRELGTRTLVAALGDASERPGVFVSSSSHDYYGDRGDAPLDEDEPPGSDFLAQCCHAWEREAQRAADLGIRVATIRTGLVLDAHRDGALGRMARAARWGVAGPVAGGRQFVSWIHIADEIGIIVSALEQEAWHGPVNATAPHPVTNRELAKSLGRVLRRPAVVPVPAAILRLLYGEMSHLLIKSDRVVPAKAERLGYRFRYPTLTPALEDLLARTSTG